MFSARAPRPTARCVCARAAPRVSKRQVLGLLPGLYTLTASSALALIPDDDDEEMVNKAKANRAARLKEDKEANRKYIDSSGLRDRSSEQELVPVQTAVYKLAKAGDALQKGDASSAASTLSGSWVSDFNNAAGQLTKTPDNESKLQAVTGGISDAVSAAKGGDIAAAKSAYVGAVVAIQAWASSTGVAGQLKGL